MTTVIQSIREMKNLITVPILATKTGLSKKAIYNCVERGTIPYLRLGTAIRFDPKEIADWLEQRHIP